MRTLQRNTASTGIIVLNSVYSTVVRSSFISNTALVSLIQTFGKIYFKKSDLNLFHLFVIFRGVLLKILEDIFLYRIHVLKKTHMMPQKALFTLTLTLFWLQTKIITNRIMVGLNLMAVLVLVTAALVSLSKAVLEDTVKTSIQHPVALKTL